MTPLTVCCVWVQGEYPYTVQYVDRLYGMVRRWLDRPFEFVCLTDRPWLLPEGVRAVPIQKRYGFAPWSKLELFAPGRWQGRVLYLDLDSLIVAPLDPIVDVEADFAITADPPRVGQKKTRDSFGRAIVRRFNSSVMVWDADVHTELATDWTPSVGDRLSGDQDWIGERLPGAVTMPRAWFPRLSECLLDVTTVRSGDREYAESIPTEAKVVLAKVPKNHIAAAQWPWFEERWRAA